MKVPKIKWIDIPEDHDYPAAESYLNLIYPEGLVKRAIDELKKEEIKIFKAKDIFRASRLSLLGVSNSHVKKNLKKIKKGEPISPLLLVKSKGVLIIADGYHRLCAVYQKNEDIDVPVKITTI